MDYVPDTPVVIPPACPHCEPDRDPRDYDVRHCDAHTPARRGADDAAVTDSGYISSGTEAGGDDNRAWCNLLHRRT